RTARPCPRSSPASGCGTASDGKPRLTKQTLGAAGPTHPGGDALRKGQQQAIEIKGEREATMSITQPVTRESDAMKELEQGIAGALDIGRRADAAAPRSASPRPVDPKAGGRGEVWG